MTLLLGPPTCGKSTLLLALPNRLDPNLKVEGKVTYNGYEFHEFVAQNTCLYVSQNVLHQGELIVRETLDFSAGCQGIGARFDLLEELCRRERELGIRPDPDVDFYLKATAVEGNVRNFSTEYTLKILSLDVCSETLVGDVMRRGISGGQKTRVTTGELIVGPARVLLMDQISDGLDSSTTFQIIKCMGQLAHYMDYTVVISLLQPAPEAFALFDDVVLKKAKSFTMAPESKPRCSSKAWDSSALAEKLFLIFSKSLPREKTSSNIGLPKASPMGTFQ